MIQLVDYKALKDQDDYKKLPDDNDMLSVDLTTSADGFTQKRFREELEKITSQNVIKFPEEKVDKEFKILKSFNGEYWTQQYVGFLQISCGDKTEEVFISSRFDKNVDKDGNKNHYFTHYLLSKAFGLDGRILKDMEIKTGTENILEELLAIVFIEQMNKAACKGLFRRYRTYEKNDAKVKGKIDLTRHIKLNPLFNGKIAYSYREYTADNDVNRLIFTAYTYLEKKQKNLIRILTKDKKNVSDCIRQLKNMIQPASKQEAASLVRRENKKITHSIYKDWEDVRRTAILILRHMGVCVNDAKSNEIKGILINMNHIWEKYPESLLKDSMKISSQEERKIIFDFETAADGKAIITDKNRRSEKPDLLVRNDVPEKTPLLILDAKYKNAWESIANGEFKGEKKTWDDAVRDDVHQILSYMYVFQCDRAGVICPCSTSSVGNKLEYRVREDGTGEFYIFPIVIPQAENMSDFKEKMKDSENDFIKCVNKVLESTYR